MTITNSASACLVLPTRIRSRLGPSTGYAARSRLADRISKLPGIRTFEDIQQRPPGIVGAFLSRSPGSLRGHPAAVPYCRIAPNGVSVEGLSDAERYHVIKRGWGRLESSRILLFLPRDDDEFDVCWYILRHAYATISRPPARIDHAVRPPLPELPEFSRTTLC